MLSVSVIDLASATLKSTAHAYFSFYASGVQLVMKSNHAATVAKPIIHDIQLLRKPVHLPE